METALLQTKLFVPQLRPPIVSRPQLIKRLNAGLFNQEQPGPGQIFDRKLTLVSAPAGFGKTTLLAEWIHGFEDGHTESDLPPFAWLSLDERDNDPNRFLIYTIAALQRVYPRIGRASQVLLTGPGSNSMESILITLVNEIAQPTSQQGSGGSTLALVLDDYHLIQAQAIHDAIAYLVDHLPPQMHLVIASRIDPPLPLARLRGRGYLVEIHADDLRFSRQQAEEFLNDVMRLDLSPQLVADLATFTEGWIAGLQMIAVSFKDRSPQDSAIIQQAGERLISDYLFDEVLASQPEEVQRFLLMTSIMDRLCGQLCDALTGRSDGQAMLERIEQANLFIVALDGQKKWYRYHHLFASLLQKHLVWRDPTGMPELHRRASAWLAANGPQEAAIKHALAAGDSQQAALLMEQGLDQIMMRGEFVSLLEWLDTLPSELLETRPRLSAYHALVMILAGRPLNQVELKIEQATSADASGLVSGEVTLLKGILAVMGGDGQRGYDLTMQALELLPETDRFFQSLLFRNLATVYKQTGDVRAARLAIEEGARIAQTSGDHLSTIVAKHQMAEVCILSGQLQEASLLCQDALESAVDQDGQPLIVAAKVLATLGELFREWDDLKQAASYLDQALELAGRSYQLWAMGGHIILARVRQAQGDMNAALKSIQIARQMAIAYDSSEVDDLFVSAYQARIWLLAGNCEAAKRWAHERGLLPGPGYERPASDDIVASKPYHLHEFESITLARLLLTLDQPSQALTILASLLTEANRLGRTHSIIEIEALRALAQRALARRGAIDLTEAVSTLHHALTLAEPGGYVRLFIEMGAPMGEMLKRLSELGLALEYGDKLLSRIDADGPWQPAKYSPEQSLIDPLSQRELEVLRLLTSHLTSTEIALELNISANTVRFHTKNIYSKLGVHSRSEAVEQARALALL